MNLEEKRWRTNSKLSIAETSSIESVQYHTQDISFEGAPFSEMDTIAVFYDPSTKQRVNWFHIILRVLLLITDSTTSRDKGQGIASNNIIRIITKKKIEFLSLLFSGTNKIFDTACASIKTMTKPWDGYALCLVGYLEVLNCNETVNSDRYRHQLDALYESLGLKFKRNITELMAGKYVCLATHTPKKQRGNLMDRWA